MTTQTDLFERFCGRSEKMQAALENMISAANLYNEYGTPLPYEYSEWEKAVEVLQSPTKEGIFDISDEISKLREIMDIVDELNAIEDVIRQQKRALEMLRDLP